MEVSECKGVGESIVETTVTVEGNKGRNENEANAIFEHACRKMSTKDW